MTTITKKYSIYKLVNVSLVEFVSGNPDCLGGEVKSVVLDFYASFDTEQEAEEYITSLYGNFTILTEYCVNS